MKTPKPQHGTWILTAPDGRTWQGDSPLQTVSAEQRERVPASVGLARIFAANTYQKKGTDVMRVTQHISNNDVLRAPSGSTVDECRPAPITRNVYSDGTPSVSTYWKPSAEEIAAIAAGHPVKVEVLGQTMPPMMVTTEATP